MSRQRSTLKILYPDLWPLRRTSARKITPAEREYRARVRANKQRITKEQQARKVDRRNIEG